MRHWVDVVAEAEDLISIHAPVKGATGRQKYFLDEFENFNPRTREGCDSFLFVAIFVAIQISIHAPVKGATFSHANALPSFDYFNPRTREGCDLWLAGNFVFV